MLFKISLQTKRKTSELFFFVAVIFGKELIVFALLNIHIHKICFTLFDSSTLKLSVQKYYLVSNPVSVVLARYQEMKSIG